MPEKIKKVLGDPKLIYLIRDPVERILSDYTQMVDWDPTKPSFAEILPRIKDDKEQYVECSSYFMQLSQYLKFFPRENILVVVQERMLKDRRSVLREVFRFLGVDDTFWTPQFVEGHNRGDTKYYEADWFKRLCPKFLREELENGHWMPWPINRALHRVARIGGAPIVKPKLSQEDDLRLQGHLKDDVADLRKFLGDPLPEWRPYL